jgi:hypothetical protein
MQYACPLVGNATLPSPNPSLASECAPPSRTGGEGGAHTRLRVRGWGRPKSGDVLRKKKKKFVVVNKNVLIELFCFSEVPSLRV